MKKHRIVRRLCSVGLAAALLAGSATAFAQRRHYEPTVRRERATEIALARVPGSIVATELEREHGRWIWSFEIRAAPRRVMEVNVDAETGAIVEVSRD